MFDVPRSPLIGIWVVPVCSYKDAALKKFVRTPFDTGARISAGYISAKRVVGVHRHVHL